MYKVIPSNRPLGICAGYQYHINADIAMAHWHYFLYTYDLEWLRDKAWPIIFDAAEMFVDFVQFSLNNSNGSIWTFAITDPVRCAQNTSRHKY
jgi:trehalose/maltose hydrolase-like predicted phosphorylase